MAFGLTQWLISFAIFLAILTIITWSAIHLGKKSQNSIDISLRFLDDEYQIEWKKSTSRVTESTDSPTLFANDQGSEIPDSAEFYKILRVLQNITIKNYSIATATSSIVGNDLMWDYDTTITLSNISEQTFLLDDRQHANKKVTILPDHISQTAHSTRFTHEAKLFTNINKLWESNTSQSAVTELTELLRDDINGTSHASVTVSFTRAFSDVEQSNITGRTKSIRVT